MSLRRLEHHYSCAMLRNVMNLDNHVEWNVRTDTRYPDREVAAHSTQHTAEPTAGNGGYKIKNWSILHVVCSSFSDLS